MFSVLKGEDNRVLGPIWVSEDHFSGPTWGGAHRAEIGCLRSKNDFSEIDPGTYSEGQGVKKTRFYRDLSRF